MFAAWQSKKSKEAEVEKGEAYYMARQAFRAMHPDSDIPLAPKNLEWTDEGSNQFLLEADGSRIIAKTKVPSRWVVHLHHSGTTWSVDKSDWK